GPQPVELRDIAKVLGRDGLIEAGGEGLVVDHRRQIGERRRRAAGFAAVGRVRHLAVVHLVLGLGLGGLAVAGLGILRRRSDPLRGRGLGRVALVGLPLAFVGVAGLAVVTLVVVALRAELVAHIERGDHVADDLGELRLVGHGVGQARQIIAGAL